MDTENRKHNAKTDVSGMLPLQDLGSTLEYIGKYTPAKFHCPRCKDRVYYPDDCQKCWKELLWRGNDR